MPTAGAVYNLGGLQRIYRPVRRLNAIRVREIIRIDEERGKLLNGLCMLINAHGHLQENASVGDTPVMEELMAIIGPMESENKALDEKRSDLWQAVLALDGVKLSSKEITKEQMRVEKGITWLQRVLSHIRKEEITGHDGEAALMTLCGLDSLLRISHTELGKRQREYQLAQAKVKSENAD